MLSIQHFHDELYNTSEELKLEERVIQALVEKTKIKIQSKQITDLHMII
jgi:hypothetical protein